MSSISKFKEKIRESRIKGEPEKGIKLVKQCLTHRQPTDEIMLDLAYFLYHYPYYVKKPISEKEKLKYLNQAKKICQNIIKKDKKIENQITFNAVLTLVKIYALLKDKKAITLAKQAYRLKKRYAALHSLADAYEDLGKINRAFYWRKKAIKLSKPEEILFAKADLAILYLKANKKKVAKKQIEKLLQYKPQNKEERFLLQQLNSIVQQIKKVG
jgi:tetratricopeptide (TPR) repeat protein